ncbi:MAG: xanthine dehydrogenase family protein [Alphaproteobacteria bacterium]|nr:xanthine dehydrogenase family protein [Alphaproteobacteria bacterium]
MSSHAPSPPEIAVLGRPNSYIGRSVPRPNAKRLVAGRGKFVDDVRLPRMVHLAFLRSPYAHARIRSIDASIARTMPGVVAVITARELAGVMEPWVGVLTHMKGLKSAPQYPLAPERATWQGEAVAAVAAATRAEAEDAAATIVVDWEELPAVTDPETALDPATPVIHPELGDNLAFENRHDIGDVDDAFRRAAVVVEQTFHFARHTGTTLEPRAIVADWNPDEGKLTVYMSNQAPQMMQGIMAKHLAIPEASVRIICNDVGGGFGLKVHTYADEMAAAAIARVLARPVKFVADRVESFATDIHARAHRVKGRMGLGAQGELMAIEIDDLTGIGPYSVYPRTSAMEATQVLNFTGGPYRFANYRARVRAVFQNKTPMCQYRAVGHPIAFTVTDGLLEEGARRLGLDPVEVRRKNLFPDDAYPARGVTGILFEGLSHHKSLDKLVDISALAKLRAERDSLRAKGVHRGIGMCAMIELTNPGPAAYGIGGARISSQDGSVARLDASGRLVIQTSATEQGQGAEAVIAQVAASAFGVHIDDVRVATGDTDVVPTGGGTWGSRATGIAGEATLRACVQLRRNVLEIAGGLLQAAPETLDIRDGRIVDEATGTERMPIGEISRIAFFRPDTLPEGYQMHLIASANWVPRKYPVAFTNAMHACHVEVDTETGEVRVLGHWVVEDCGTPVNPQLVEEQVRGGVVQGLGGALLEECRYDVAGNLLNANMADYLVPMAVEMPDIGVGHCITPTKESALGAKGAGEAGTGGAPAALLNAVNDALAPLGVRITVMPVTPDSVLRALVRC